MVKLSRHNMNRRSNSQLSRFLIFMIGLFVIVLFSSMHSTEKATLDALSSSSSSSVSKQIGKAASISTTSTNDESSSSSTTTTNPKFTEEYLTSFNKDLCNDKKESTYALANKQSFGYFNDIPCEQWNRKRQITSKNTPHAYPDQPLYRINIPHSWYQMNYEPNFSCPFEQRVGGNGNGDGPKWMCDPHRLVSLSKERKEEFSETLKKVKGNEDLYFDNETYPGCIIYSIGSNGDFKYEVSVQELLGKDTCEIHIFDMGDYEHLMPKGLNLHYHKWGITNAKNVEKGSGKPSQAFFEGSIQKKFARWFGFRKETFKSFEETVKLLHHDKLPSIDVLKIDCEGCEWDVYQDWFKRDKNGNSIIPRIGQILVEVHRSPNKAIEFFDAMYDQGYVTFHKEPNTQYAGGNCVEYAFMKLDKEYFDY